MIIHPKRVPLTEKKTNERKFERIISYNKLEFLGPEPHKNEIPITYSVEVERMKQIEFTRKLLSKTYMKIMSDRMDEDPYLVHICDQMQPKPTELNKLITVLSCHSGNPNFVPQN